MAEKKSTKKTTAKKPRYATLEPVKEEVEVKVKKEVVKKIATQDIRTPMVPQRTEVIVVVQARFSKTNLDEIAATYAHSEKTGELYIKDGQNGAWGADIEIIFDSDLLIENAKTGAKRVVSKTENPLLWLTSLHEGVLGRPYKALEATTHDET
tara:strand:- start:3429 stop:3887 length:459 start_codon:yes stop_codon:yes gene_type:complete